MRRAPDAPPRRMLVAAGMALLMAVVVGIHSFGVRPPAWYPPCLFHRVTQLHCPGCGSARALHALGQGDIVRALDQNLLAVAMLPVLAVWAAITARRMWRGAAFSASLPGGWALGVLIAVVLFWILRNLPWWPFVLLAPE